MLEELIGFFNPFITSFSQHDDATDGTRIKNSCTTWMGIFGSEKVILKTMMFSHFSDLTTVLNERKHLKMMTIRSVPVSVSLILGQTK